MSKVVQSSLKSAVKGATLLFAGNALSIIVWFVTKLVIIRTLSKEDLGIYSLAVAIVSILALIAGTGIQDGSTRFISMFLAEGKEDDAASAARSSVKIGFVSGLVTSVLLLLLSEPVSNGIFYMPKLSGPLAAISFFILFYVQANIFIGVIRGYGDVKPRVYYINLGQPVYFMIGLIAVFLLNLQLLGVIYAFMISMGLSYLSIGAYGYSKHRLNLFSLKGGEHKMELLKFSLPLLGITFMSMVFGWTDTLMLGRYTQAEDVGVYNVSLSLVKLLMYAASAAGFVFMPIAGEMYAKRQMDDLKRTYQVLTKWVFSATLPLFFILFFFPEMSISFLFGDRYIAASESLKILTIGFMFNVFVGTNIMLMIVMGLSKELMHVSVFGTILNIVVNYVLIKRLDMGINGAAIATSVSYIAISLINSYMLFKASRIHPITARYLRPIAGSAVVALLIYVLAKSLPLYWWMLPVYFFLFIIGYILSFILTRGVDKEDIDLLEAIARRTGLKVDGVIRLISRLSH